MLHTDRIDGGRQPTYGPSHVIEGGCTPTLLIHELLKPTFKLPKFDWEILKSGHIPTIAGVYWTGGPFVKSGGR